jgi:hypothetical protein
MRIGTLKRLTQPCLGNPAGTVGVCYEVYIIDEGTDLCTPPGASFIFPNGEYDGFSDRDAKMFFDDWEGFCPELQNYQFTNVMKLSRDFDAGLFKKAWTE